MHEQLDIELNLCRFNYDPMIVSCGPRTRARYGLRGELLGEASNPGPERESSRTPLRGDARRRSMSESSRCDVPRPSLRGRQLDFSAAMVSSRIVGSSDVSQQAAAWDYKTFFDDAMRGLDVSVEALFVPRGMLCGQCVPAYVHANDDVKALREAFRMEQFVWIHGNQSIAYRTLLRERCVKQCVISDVVRSDTGYLGEVTHALAAPLGVLSSEMFCRTVKSLVIVDRAGGWQDDAQHSSCTFLFAFRCGLPGARCKHDVEVSRVELASPESQVELAVPVVGGEFCQLVVESRADLACIQRWCHEGTVRIQRAQHRQLGHRWILAVRSGIVEQIVDVLRRCAAVVTNLGLMHEACAVVFLPKALFFDFVDAVQNASSSDHVSIMREAI